MSKMLGHASVQITLDRYSHLFPNVAEAVAGKLDAIYIAAESAELPMRTNLVELQGLSATADS